MCLYPTLIKNRKYTVNKKNGGNVPPVTDQRVKWVPIGCQQCIECRKQKARGWQVRLLEDIKKHRNGKFITLTISNEYLTHIIQKIQERDQAIADELEIQLKPLEGYDLDNEIATYAVRHFLERHRKEYGISLRHWLVTELGHNGTENIHIHGIIWTNINLGIIEQLWKYGWVWKGDETTDGKLLNYVNEATVNYIIKYVNKADEIHKEYKSKILTSPGIGSNYTEGYDWKKNKYQGNTTNETYRTRTGHKIAMPTYWRNKVYNDQEREKLWLQRLDKHERWICGEKVKINNGEEAYYRLLKYHREINSQLGYGDGTKDWDRHQYEKQRRTMLTEYRIQQATKTTTD